MLVGKNTARCDDTGPNAECFPIKKIKTKNTVKNQSIIQLVVSDPRKKKVLVLYTVSTVEESCIGVCLNKDLNFMDDTTSNRGTTSGFSV